MLRYNISCSSFICCFMIVYFVFIWNPLRLHCHSKSISIPFAIHFDFIPISFSFHFHFISISVSFRFHTSVIPGSFQFPENSQQHRTNRRKHPNTSTKHEKTRENINQTGGFWKPWNEQHPTHWTTCWKKVLAMTATKFIGKNCVIWALRAPGLG